MKKMESTFAKTYAYDVAAVEDSISIVRRCTINNKKDVMGFLIVNKNTTSTLKNEDFLTVAFNAGLQKGDGPKEICEITPKEYKDILNKKRKLPKGWKLEEVLFDGTYVFKEFDKLVEAIQDWPYAVEIDDCPESRILGYKCKTGRKWQINFSDFKKTSKHSFSTNSDKIEFLRFLNSKTKFKEVK
jgi:hypothetical protein